MAIESPATRRSRSASSVWTARIQRPSASSRPSHRASRSRCSSPREPTASIWWDSMKATRAACASASKTPANLGISRKPERSAWPIRSELASPNPRSTEPRSLSRSGLFLRGGLVKREGVGAAGRTRTPDQKFRKLLLYPPELQPQNATRSIPTRSLRLGSKSDDQTATHRANHLAVERQRA